MTAPLAWGVRGGRSTGAGVAPSDATPAAPTRPSGPPTLRPYESDDFEPLLQAYARVFEGGAGRLRNRWNWSQEQNLFPDRTYRWVLSRGDAVVGFLGTVPQPYVIGGNIVIAHTPSDYFVLPGERFHGLSLMRAFVRQCANCVTVDDVEATIAVNRWLGIRPVATFGQNVLPLDPRALLLHRRTSSLRQLVRSMLASLRVTSRDVDAVEPVIEPDERFDELAADLALQVPAMVKKDRRFLQWRYRGDSPHRSARIVAATGNGGRLEGYAVLSTPARGSLRGVILDLQTRPGDAATIQKLLAYAVAYFRRRCVASVAYQRLTPRGALVRGVVDRDGFVSVPSALQLMTRLTGGAVAPTDGWWLSVGDAENSHDRWTH